MNFIKLITFIFLFAIFFFGYTYKEWGSFALISMIAAISGITSETVKIIKGYGVK